MKPFILLILLAACGTQPTPALIGAQRQTVQVAGRDYTVIWNTRMAEVIRHGWASAGEHQAIRATMLRLVPQVTGCKINERGFNGDSGEMRGPITCP